jgi:large subunit ribosomal protein L30
MAQIKITQVRSTINRPARQKATMVALGIRKMNHSVIHEATPQILGMVRKVEHLVQVQEVEQA